MPLHKFGDTGDVYLPAKNEMPKTQAEASEKSKCKLKVTGELGFSDKIALVLRSFDFFVEREVGFPCRKNPLRADIMMRPPAHLSLPATILVEAKIAAETSAITAGAMQLIRYYRSFCGTPDGNGAWGKPALYLLATPESVLDGHLSAWSSKFLGKVEEWPNAAGYATLFLDRLLWRFGPISIMKKIGSMVGFESNWLGESDGAFYPIADAVEFAKRLSAVRASETST